MSKWFRWLERLGVDPALVGDLHEDYLSGRSTVWLLWQSFTAAVLAFARTSSRRVEAFLNEPDVRDLLDFFLGPVRIVPWRVATVFGAFLGLELLANDLVFSDTHYVAATWAGAVTCFVGGFVGAKLCRGLFQCCRSCKNAEIWTDTMRRLRGR